MTLILFSFQKWEAERRVSDSYSVLKHVKQRGGVSDSHSVLKHGKQRGGVSESYSVLKHGKQKGRALT